MTNLVIFSCGFTTLAVGGFVSVFDAHEVQGLSLRFCCTTAVGCEEGVDDGREESQSSRRGKMNIRKLGSRWSPISLDRAGSFSRACHHYAIPRWS